MNRIITLIGILIFTSCIKNDFTITLLDNGVGFNTEKPFKKGLLNIKNRASKINATLKITSDTEGTMVKFTTTLPILASTDMNTN